MRVFGQLQFGYLVLLSQCYCDISPDFESGRVYPFAQIAAAAGTGYLIYRGQKRLLALFYCQPLLLPLVDCLS